MKKMNSRLLLALKYLNITFLSFGMLFWLIYRMNLLINKISILVFLSAVLFMVVLLRQFFNIFDRLSKRVNDTTNIFILLSMVFLIRLIYVGLINTKPVSDFGCYYEYAKKAADGFFKGYDGTFLLYRFRFGYSLFLAVILKIFGKSVIVAKIMNVFLSTFLAFILYKSAKLLVGKRSAYYCVILFAFWPSQIMFNSVLATEHLFSLVVMIGVYFIIKYMKFDSYKYLIIAGLFFGYANHIRPVAIVFMVSFCIGVLIWKRDLKAALNLVISYFISFFIIAFIIYKLTSVQVWQTSAGLNLMIGTDYTTLGMNNPKHSQFVAKYNYDFKKMHSDAFKVGVNVLRYHTIDFIRILPKKHAIMWGEDTYGYFWSTFRIYSESKEVVLLRSHPSIFTLICQVYYFAILLFIIKGIISYKKGDLFFAFINLSFFLFVITHFLLEVQPRYHYLSIITMLLLGAFWINEKKIQYVKKTDSK